MAGLHRSDPKTKEGKFLVTRRDGTIPKWPHFVLGGRDPILGGPVSFGDPRPQPLLSLLTDLLGRLLGSGDDLRDARMHTALSVRRP